MKYGSEEWVETEVRPLLIKADQRRVRKLWVELGSDPLNKHLHELAKERIKYIDDNPDEYPYPWMKL